MKFDEGAYLEAHPDVALGVKSGITISGQDHYEKYGKAEGRRLRNRNSRLRGRILIAGTGRAGTTALVQIFTALNFDTGFELSQAMSSTDPVSHAGLEHLLSADAPLVVKSPWLVDYISDSIPKNERQNSFAIIPMRSLKDAAESRRRVGRIASEQGEDPAKVAGGLWLTNDPTKQESVLLERFYETMYRLVQSEIQTIMIEFPKFTTDIEYLYNILYDIWNVYGVSKKELLCAYDLVIDSSKINFR